MKSRMALVILGLSIVFLWGCSPVGRSYWLTYNANSNVAPASTYIGYYDIDLGSDDLVVACLGVKEEEPERPLPQGRAETDEDYKKRRAPYDKWKTRNEQYQRDIHGRTCPNLNNKTKPSVSDRDQAKIAVFRTTPGTPDFKGMECHITQTKIARVPVPVFTMGRFVEKDVNPSVFYCDLSVTDAGGMRLDFAIRPPTESKKIEGQTAKTILATDVVNDSVEVHTLYRFRVMAGPVYSTLSDDDRTFTAKSHASGNSFIASDVKGNPVNAAVFLKLFWQPRNVYDTKQWFDDPDCPVDLLQKLPKKLCALAQRINPIVGVNVSNNPLEGVYVGGSFEILNGLDIVGGVHWSSVETLSGGFTPGQLVASGTTAATEKKILQGWFTGISLDLGVAGSWLGKTTMGILK